MSFPSRASSRTTGTVSSYFSSSAPPNSPSYQSGPSQASDGAFESEYDRSSRYSPSIASSRPSAAFTAASTTTSRPATPSGRRSRNGATPSILGQSESHDIICAVSEARGVTPTVGIAVINLSLGEATLSQICDNQSYVRTIHKLQLACPSRIVFMPSACSPNEPSTLFSLVQRLIPEAEISSHDRSAWAETAGIEYMEHLAPDGDIGPIKVAIQGKYYAVCCFSAVGRLPVLLSSLERLICTNLGHEVHRSSVQPQLLTSVATYPIPALRRHDDDRHISDAVTRSNAKPKVRQIERMPVWAVKPYTYAYGFSRAS